MKKQDEGFTLIELLIVIVILGILAAVVVFAVGGITDKGQTSSCKAELKTVEVAVEAFRAQGTAYPTDAAAIGAFVNDEPTWYAPNGGTATAIITRTPAGVTVCDDVTP